MGHSIVKCDNCGTYIMEGFTGEWDCDECGWTYNANIGKVTKHGNSKKSQINCNNEEGWPSG